MDNFENHEPREIQITDEDVQVWLKENKSVVNHEVLSAIEKYVYDNSDKPICALVLTVNDSMYGDVVLKVSITGKEIMSTLESINRWAVTDEEYEMCQRVKNLNEYIEKTELHFTNEN